MWYKILKNTKDISASEEAVVSYWTNSVLQYIITFSKTKQMYYLYEVSGNVAAKTKAKSKSPIELEKKIH